MELGKIISRVWSLLIGIYVNTPFVNVELELEPFGWMGNSWSNKLRFSSLV
jgi:hypothetical protein